MHGTRARKSDSAWGFVPQSFDDFDWLTPSQCLELVSRFYDTWDADLVDGLREAWQLPDARLGTLSPGLRQRVAVLLAIGHRPDLLLLDEPVAALDPVARRDFLRLIGTLNAESGQTVLLSSHICSDIERICSDVAILHGGRVVVHRPVDDLKDDVRMVSGAAGDAFGDDVVAANGHRVWLRNWRAHDLSDAYVDREFNLEEFFLDLTS